MGETMTIPPAATDDRLACTTHGERQSVRAPRLTW